jgi:hypothetical protein
MIEATVCTQPQSARSIREFGTEQGTQSSAACLGGAPGHPAARLLEFRLPAVPQGWGSLAHSRGYGRRPLPRRGWAEEAGRRTAWTWEALELLSPVRCIPRRLSGKHRPGYGGPRVRSELQHRADFSRDFGPPLPPPSVPSARLGPARSSRYGCAAEVPVAAASAVAGARPSAALPLTVGAACGDGSRDVGPALLLPGGGRGGRRGGGVAAATLGRAEHRGGGWRGAGRPCVLPAVWGPQSRPLGASGPGTRGPAPRQGAAAHPGGCCQGDGKCLSACAHRAGDARGLDCQVCHLPREGLGVAVTLD